MKKVLLMLLMTSLVFFNTSCFGLEEQTSDHPDSSGEIEETIFKYDVYHGKSRIKESLSIGKSYTFSRDVSAAYPDHGVLTDGVVASENEDSLDYVGFVGKNPLAITMDLGEVYSDVSNFTASFLISDQHKCNVPRSFDVELSLDGEHFVHAASVACSLSDCRGSSYEYDVTLQKGADCRYVRFIFDDFSRNRTLISELSVNRILEGEETERIGSDSYYVCEPLPEVTQEEFFDPSEDTGSDMNLIAELTARVSSQMPLYEQYHSEWSNSPASKSSVLTDGKKGNYDLNDKAFFHLNRGYKRDFVYDLGKIGAVSGYSFSGLQEFSSAVYVPDQVELWLSVNGKDWECVHYTMPSTDSTKLDLYEFSYDLDEKYQARFIKITFTVTAYIWLDEISVFGRKSAEGAQALVYETDEYEYPNAYRDTSEYTQNGIPENIALLCTYKVGNMETFRLTAEQIIPYISYVDLDGNIKDTFMDGINLTPPYGNAASGASFLLDEANPSTMDDWVRFYDEVFLDGFNVDAIEEAAGIVKKALHLGDDYKIKVSVPVCNAACTQSHFGDIDGDGVDEDLSAIENRMKAMRWSIDYVKKAFEEKHYANVVLGGFYYLPENITTWRNDTMAVVKDAIDYAHEQGYYFIWIPYAEATGFVALDDLGFDAVTMQPNYMFKSEWPAECVDVCASISKKYGIGVEIEMDGSMFSSNAKYNRFLLYLEEGARLGYMKTIKMYYQDAGPGLIYRCCESADGKEREIYDRMYFYAQRRYLTDIGEIIKTSFDGTANTENRFALETKETPNFIGAKIRTAPLHGRASIDVNGIVIYIPEDGFTGSDSFSIALPYSEEIVIDINIS